MRPAALAVLAVALASIGVAARSSGGLAHFSDTPARPHAALGPVAALAAPDPDGRVTSLAQAARERYGRVDALIAVRPAPLPDGAIRLEATAIVWDRAAAN